MRLPLSKKRNHLEKFMSEVVSTIRVLPYGQRAARWHAAERARLANAARPPPFLDGQVAAIAAVNRATVVTANVGDFECFAGLSIVNWAG